MKHFRSPLEYSFSILTLLFLFGLSAKAEAEIRFLDQYISFTQTANMPLMDMPKWEAWQKAAPNVVQIGIPRQTGEPDQPALWYHSGSRQKKPILLVLHSWSEDYLQQYGIPYSVFAEKNDWVFIHPNYRGKFDNPDATGSEKAVQDVLDALEYAKENAPVDENRIYLAGFSGGAAMALIMSGRYPEKFTAALAWVPVYDLNDWYNHVTQSGLWYTAQYKADIEASCGGNPDTEDQARESCRKRSPSSYLARARGKDIRVFISGGIQDPFVPPSHAIRAFNALSSKRDRIPEPDYGFIDAHEKLPENLAGQGREHRFFDEAGLPVVFERTSNNATLVLFEGGHDIVYNAGFQWLVGQHRPPEAE
jgi:predicted esterase